VRSMDASGADRIVGEVDGVDWYHVPIWSPDGRTLAVELITFGEHGDTPRLGLVDVENGVGREVDVDLYHGVSKEWSPDSTTLLISPSIGITAQRQLLVDARTLQVSTPPWTSTSYPAWQRLP
jgi:dipeptidyl aminopeptidase/acylaminoacyl peptidase